MTKISPIAPLNLTPYHLSGTEYKMIRKKSRIWVHWTRGNNLTFWTWQWSHLLMSTCIQQIWTNHSLSQTKLEGENSKSRVSNYLCNSECLTLVWVFVWDHRPSTPCTGWFSLDHMVEDKSLHSLLLDRSCSRQWKHVSEPNTHT